MEKTEGMISEKDFFKKVNDYRTSQGQKTLTWSQYQRTLTMMAENSEIIRMIMEVKEEKDETTNRSTG